MTPNDAGVLLLMVEAWRERAVGLDRDGCVHEADRLRSTASELERTLAMLRKGPFTNPSLVELGAEAEVVPGDPP